MLFLDKMAIIPKGQKVAEEDPKHKLIADIIKNPTIFILILVFMGYVDIRTLPTSIERIGVEGTENLESIKNEIIYLRRDIREQIEEIKVKQSAINLEIEATNKRVSALENQRKL
jgi:hypothetical protein